MSLNETGRKKEVGGSVGNCEDKSVGTELVKVRL